ncbi:carbohydrate kinase family protein [Marinitoga aeolica]|uniref:Sugar kinase, ribokinase n=1 Tax=Marinitoga aeolica TaxID=2809031 RepID=A0ABY8PP96_9BACT|nr:hypothetical protein [Marinitoga aeolica]WGS64458.1 hypothetical protein JRV97_08755 [Marinitoga aeolica]
MEIDVYGATFYDIYILGDAPHNSKIIEIPGGSGFNIAYTLYKLGYEINFNSFIGNDHKGKYLEDMIPFKLEKVEEKTATFISRNGNPLAVERKINDSNFKKIEKKSDVAIITTELSIKELIEIEKLGYKKIFFDIGPRPFIAENIFNNAFVLGTEKECKYRNCNLIKLGNRGIKFNNEIYNSNGKIAKYKTGLGDIFDAFFIHYILNNYSIEEAIKISIDKVEKVLDIPGAYNKINYLI